MLEKANSLLLHKLGNHVAQNSAHGIESFIGRANIAQTDVVEKDFLHDKDSHSFAQLRSRLHDTETERDDLRGQEEVDHVGRIILHQRADNTQGRESEVFEGTRLGGGVEKGVEEKRDVS